MAREEEEYAHPELVDGENTTKHKHKLNSCSSPDAAVDFNQQEATGLIIENRTSDPSSPVDGQIWLRTDL